MDNQETEYQGECYCGSVQVSVKGPPVASGYCHCSSCRKWHAAPINAWSVWNAADVTITGGEVRTSKGEASRRKSCVVCGGCVANEKPQENMIVVYPMTLAGSALKYEPTLHIFYSERVMDIRDELPKYADMPEEYGGSGELIEQTGHTGWRA